MSVAIPIPLLQNLPDVNVSLGVGVDEYALTYDHDTARFVLRAPATPFAGILATGATVGATAQAQAFTLGVVSPFVSPAADSTTAWQVRKADKATSVLNVDTTNGWVGIGTTSPQSGLHVETRGIFVQGTNAGGYILEIKGTSASGGFERYGNNIKLSAYHAGLNSLSVGSSYFADISSDGTAIFSVAVGINTTAPATALHVAGAATITGGIRPAADSTTALQFQNVAGTSVLNVDTTNGYVGIGTTTPEARFHISGVSPNYSYVMVVNPTSLAQSPAGIVLAPTFTQTNGTGTVAGVMSSITATIQATASIVSAFRGRLYITNEGTIDIAASAYLANPSITGTAAGWSGALYVQDGKSYFGGNVGINDTAPAEALDVTGNINATGVYKVDDVQVLSNRVIDARCADVANSGDATTDGLIDALRDALVAHGLIAASA